MLTNICKLACVLSLFMGVVGCGDSESMTSGPDLATSSGSHDMAQPTSNGDMAKTSNMDGGGTDGGGGGLLPICQTCTKNTDCASGMCLPYMGGTVKKCSHSCQAATASTDCPGINACNGMNVCKCQ